MVNESLDRRAIDFPGKDQEEEFQFFFRQHWIRLWWPLRGLLLWTLIGALGLYASSHAFTSGGAVAVGRAMAVALVLILVIAQLVFLVKFYKYFLYVIIVTDKKIHRIKKTLLTVDDHQSIDLWILEDISKNQHGIIQNLLGFGTLHLIMQDKDTSVRIHFTPYINKKHELIMRLRELARGRMTPQRQLRTQLESNVEHAMKQVEEMTHGRSSALPSVV